MRIRKKFIQLTKRTYPYGTENSLCAHLPKGFKQDKFGNYFFQIGENPTTMFTCHLDTACSYNKSVNHVYDGDYIKTDGTTILGADDKAGMTVVLYMISKNVTGLYYFFIGEEVGCIGSSDLSKIFTDEYPNINKVVSFDRRGTSSIITHQMFGRCCSDNFASALADQYNSTNEGLSMRIDDGGILTDSAQFMGMVPECTNISVGYYGEHTKKEKQDIDFLIKICRASVKIDWENLPVERDPSMICEEYSWEEEYMLYDSYQNCGTHIKYEEYSLLNTTRIIHEGLPKLAYISQKWIDIEQSKIVKVLEGHGYSDDKIMWDGTTCWAENNDRSLVYIGSRKDLCTFIPDLMKIPNNYIRFSLTSKSSSPVEDNVFCEYI